MAPTHARGSIARVKLSNFLTYDDVEVKPAPGLNLLLGPNGTGKSTIVCALCLGLAGHPKILGRSNQMKDYIKRDEDIATIEVELYSGSEEKNPVIRTVIRRKGREEYYVNNRKMDQNQTREFVKGYHIQVDNLCQFLAQDRVVEFAGQSKQALLLNTEKAAGSVDLFEQHSKLGDRFQEGSEFRNQLAGVNQNREALEKKLAVLEKPFKQFEEYEKRREKCQLLEKKRPWVEHEQTRQDAAVLKEELDKVKEEYSQMEARFEPIRNQIRAAQDHARQAERQFENQKRQADSAKTRVLQDLNILNNLPDEMDTISSSLRLAQEKFEADQKRIKTLESTVATIQRKMEELQEEDLQPQLDKKDQELREVGRMLDELEPRQIAVNRTLENLTIDLSRTTRTLQSLQNRQQQQLQQLRQMNEQAYRGYMWYMENKDRFRGSIWLPALDIRIPDQRDIKFVEACIGNRDLFSFVCESYEDMDQFLKEMRRQNIRVAAGEVPRDNVNTRPQLADEFRRLGFRDFVCNMIDAPEGLKKYLTMLFSLNRIPVGTEETERNMERVTNSVTGRFSKFLTPNKQLVISQSRYGGGTTVQNSFLGEPRTLHRTIGNGDDSEEVSLQQQRKEVECKIQHERTLLEETNDKISDAKRRREMLIQEKNMLRQRAGERHSLETQITHKNRQLMQLRATLPDIAREEEKCNENLKTKLEEKIDLTTRIADFTKTIETRCRELAESNVNRAASSASAVSLQRQLDAASFALRECTDKKERLEADYNEKKDSVRLLLEKARRAIGLMPGSKQSVPDKIQEAFSTFPDDLEELDEQIEEQRVLLENTQGVDSNIASEYKARLAEFNRTKAQEEHLQHQIDTWETEVGTLREKWLVELQQLIETISRNFSRYMSALDCAGEVELDKPEDVNNFSAYGVKIKVKFRDSEPLRELSPQHQSGGERSVSTVLYMLALQELSHVPFRCVDEINQGMDPVNERKVFEMMTKLLSGADGMLNCTQYFMLTPKLLHGLPMGDHIEVWLIHNGPRMLPNEKWSMRKFLHRKKLLNQTGVA